MRTTRVSTRSKVADARVASLAVALALAASGLASAAVAQSDIPATPSPTSAAAVPFGEPASLVPNTYHGPLGPGRWTVTVPAGWEWYFDILWSDLGVPGTYKDVGGPGEVAFGWWQVANVFTDPCHWNDSLADPPVGPSVDDLARAFAEQVGRAASGPIDVVFGGYPAKRVELSVPADLDLATCDEGAYREFLSPDESLAIPEGVVDVAAPDVGGEVSALYIVDLDGTRWLMRTWHRPDASAQDLAELDAMLASILIGSPSPSPAASPVV